MFCLDWPGPGNSGVHFMGGITKCQIGSLLSTRSALIKCWMIELEKTLKTNL